LQELKSEHTRLEVEIGRVVQVFGALGLTVCVTVVLAYGLLRGDWWQGALSALAVAIALVPEEFPVVLALFMVLGAWRIAQKKVLTRRLSAIETLGAATVICVDKTGTLTENRMQVKDLQRASDVHTDRELLMTAAQASDPRSVDPIDRAICAAAGQDAQAPCIREYPFDSDSAFVAKAYSTSANSLLIAAKGAPEEILGRCPIADEQRLIFDRKLDRMADSGMRVIAVASTRIPVRDLPDQKKELTFRFDGLIGLADPLRPTVPSAIAELCQAGVRVAMVTGDYPGTAQSIAAQAGIPQDTDVVTGSEMEQADDAGLQSMVQRSSIFARIRPEQKLRIVQALKASGEIVAMTGDGVNDAPALKAAHIGIAMGARGSDVAREAAAVVLSDDDFPAIAAAVRLGRRIYDNLRKAVRYIIAAHIPVALLACLPVIFGWPLILTPLHIVFLELIVDPACSLAFEAEREEADVMLRKPRSLTTRLLDRPTVVLGLIQGLGLFAAALAAFLLSLKSGHGASASRAIAFTALVVGSLALIWTNRSEKRTVLETAGMPNPALWWLTAGALSTLAVLLYFPPAREMFQFAPLSTHDVLLAVAFGGGSITWFELIKVIRGRSAEEGTRAFVRRLILLTTGWICVLLGLIGLVLPILQGLLFLAIGFVLLSAEYRFAQKFVRWFRVRYPHLKPLLPRRPIKGVSSKEHRP
jgi:P-type Ca2+ transporter type 2C